jgi:ABC-type transport system involved in multi-copper enzyme maturation permease subunit
MRLSMVQAVAVAEMRSVRRLVRYWLFAILGVMATLGIYLYYAAIHGFLSRMSATIGAIGPRYLVPAMGIYLMATFLLGLIFLAFDIRARDERERMAEVLDVRPISNAELLVGRSLGLVLMAMAPVLLVAVLFQTFGSLAVLFGWYFGEPVEPWSLLGFMLHALSVFAFWCAAVILLAVVLRNRLAVTVAALALVGIQLWASFQMPISYQMAFGALFPVAPTTSDLVPSVLGGPGALRLLALFVAAGGLLALSAARHPRRDDGARSTSVALGAGLLTIAALLIGTVQWQTQSGAARFAAWREAHQSRSGDAVPDVRSISGRVRIDPGRAISLDLQMEVAAPPDRRLDTLLFTLNPGIVVEQLSGAGQNPTWSHENGLLQVTPASPLEAGVVTTLQVTASGAPDDTFGYLDSSVDLQSATLTNANLLLFGTQTGIFTSRYVALMPGQHWLPAAGPDVPAADPRTHPPDFFDLDLEVEVPAGWLVAGPGRREARADEAEVARFRFAPGAPLAEAGLLASRFERRAMEVAGVEVELLVHPSHDRNLRLFEDAAEAIADRVETLLSDAARLGLPYPYGGLTLVESPSSLRGYGGGWRMDTTQAIPGILLLRENSFTTSRFEFEFRNPARFEGTEGGLARAKVQAAERFFENDISGGNLFLGGSRNFLLFQTSARGDGAIALNFVLDDLVNQLLTGKQGYFSPYLFGPAMNATAGLIVQQVVTGQTESIVQAVSQSQSNRPSVWDRAMGVSLAELDPVADPEQALNVLTLKSPAIARSILDGLGREKTADLLAGLLTRYRGRHFTAADFRDVARDVGADLDAVVGDWLAEAGLPGFLFPPVAVERLTDDAQGGPRYQARVHVFNGESTPGLLRLRYGVGAEGTPTRWDLTDPVRLRGGESAEIGVVTAMPLRELWLRPYLSLNRNDMRLPLPRVDEGTQVKAAPLVGLRASTWRPPVTEDIVVDDLDPGFSVETDEADAGMRLAAGGFFAPPTEYDQGLPVIFTQTRPPVWSRWNAPLGWGTYRRTTAGVGSGSGMRRAIFAATLPAAGRWRLAYHLPASTLPALGTYDMTLRAGGDTRSLEFDGAAAQGGWNVIGEYDLPAGDVRVEVSDRSSGNLVVTDAVRWQRVP